jgi:IPT/TIG domain
MSEMTVIFTALPNGLAGDPIHRQARLSVYLSMRLTGADGTLNDFPQEALNWPNVVNQIQFFSVQVQLDGRSPGVAGTATVAKVVPRDDGDNVQADPTLWSALFTKDTPVTAYLAENNDLTKRPINTYSASKVHKNLTRGYRQLISDSTVDLPTHGTLKSVFPDLHAAFGPVIPSPSAPVDIGAHHLFLADNLFRPAVGSSVRQNVARAFAVARQLAETSSRGTFVPAVPSTADVASEFARLHAFHYRPPADPNNPPPPSPPVHPTKVLDFHQALQALAQYPKLLPRLGLVIDLEVPEASLPESKLDQPSQLLQIIPIFRSATDFTSYSPFTKYVLEGDKIFAAASQDAAKPEFVAGFLDLAQPGAFDLVQIDVDGLGIKGLAAAQAAQSQADDAQSAGTPAIRSAGVSLLRNEHGPLIHQRIATAVTNNNRLAQNPTEPVTLFAEDLTRGFRIDVLDVPANRWHSLHARIGHYVFSPPGGRILDLADEGLSQPSAVQVPDGPPDMQAQLYIHESLMRWHGWSLAAPRPGKTITNAGPDTVTNQANGGFPLAVNFLATPGTLPRLRFGGKYRFRARAVDLAGNSLTLPEADKLLQDLELLTRPPILPLPSQQELIYQRFEPVLSPVLVARERFTEGESLERLVIRSNGGEPVTACAARLMALVAAKRPQARAIYTAVNERHVAPPKTSQLMAETHGLLDESFGTESGFQQTYNKARKEKGRFSDTAIIDVVTGNPVPIPDTTGIDPLAGATITRPSVEWVNPPRKVAVTVKTALGNSPPGAAAMFSYTDNPQPGGGITPGGVTSPGDGPLITGINPSQGPLAGGMTVVVTGIGFTRPAEVWFGDVPADQVSVDTETQITVVIPPAPTSFAVHHEPQLLLPYLPDPMARGASFWKLPGVPQQQSGQINDSTGNLTFRDLSPSSPDILGSRAQIDFGSAWLERQPFRMQLAEPDANQPPVHPIWDPQARVLKVFLPQAEQTAVRLSSSIGPDDAELDKLGTWQFFVEQKKEAAQPASPGDLETATVGGVWMVTPFREIQLVHAVQQPLATPEFQPQPRPAIITPRDPGSTFAYFGATAKVHGKSTAKLDLLASWQERVDRPDDPGGPTTRNVKAHVFEAPIHLPTNGAPSTGQDDPVPIATYDATSDVVTFQAKPDGDPRTFRSRHEFLDTKYRRISYQLVATTRFREYFPPEVENVSQTGAAVTVDVPSTARPAAPDVVYAIPMFEWSRTTAADGSQVRTRTGGGVRVYLERPWFSSGDGEMLSVVLADPAEYPPDDSLRPFVTHWGTIRSGRLAQSLLFRRTPISPRYSQELSSPNPF